ncbi:NRDE family protein [Marinococcus halophilus]|uniref:NRDE family protein n=2 Tax=Marinococcus halophilus TaxID=1371 RepID=A0A510Y3H6_MARHA|nr:NRDE family protein [Marinococcus halophilus]GEK57845.1 hypothetical protein MHA01_07500 [Marinococcus halophilus]
MCLIALAHQAHPWFPLVVVSNRDEFLERPTKRLHKWQGEGIIAGKDLKQGGTWMGGSLSGRFAAVTNIRRPGMEAGEKSRGHLPLRFLRNETKQALEAVQKDRNEYRGFNMIAGSGKEVFYLHNHKDGPHVERLTPGVHALSNASLNTPWPKVEKAKKQIETLLASSENTLHPESFFTAMRNAEPAADQDLPDTGIDKQLEKQLSSMFIDLPEYKTRCQTLFTVRKDGKITMIERMTDARTGTGRYEWHV